MKSIELKVFNFLKIYMKSFEDNTKLRLDEINSIEGFFFKYFFTAFSMQCELSLCEIFSKGIINGNLALKNIVVMGNLEEFKIKLHLIVNFPSV